MAGHNNLGSRRDSLADFDLPGPLISKQHFGSLGRIAVGNEHVVLAVFLEHSFLGDQDCIRAGVGLDLHAHKGPWLEPAAGGSQLNRGLHGSTGLIDDRTDAVHTAVALHRFVDAQFDYSQLTGFHLVRFTFGQMHVGIQGRKGAEFEEGVEVANGPAQFDDALGHMAAEGSSNLRPRDLQLGLPDFGVQLLDTMGELAGLDGRNPLVMHEFIEPILFLVHLALADELLVKCVLKPRDFLPAVLDLRAGFLLSFSGLLLLVSGLSQPLFGQLQPDLQLRVVQLAHHLSVFDEVSLFDEHSLRHTLGLRDHIDLSQSPEVCGGSKIGRDLVALCDCQFDRGSFLTVPLFRFVFVVIFVGRFGRGVGDEVVLDEVSPASEHSNQKKESIDLSSRTHRSTQHRASWSDFWVRVSFWWASASIERFEKIFGCTGATATNGAL